MNPMMMNNMNNMNNMNMNNMNNMNMNNMNNMNMMNMNTMNNMNMMNMNNPNMNMMNMNMNMMNMGMDPTMAGQNFMNPGMMNNPMMMGGMGMGFNNSMMPMGMNNPMMMGNNMQMNMGVNMNMMTPQQREEYKKQQRYMGYLMGKKMAEEKKRAQQGNTAKVDTPVETKPITPETEVTIKFNKNGTITDIKAKGADMIAEILNEYAVKTNNKGPFKYKGRDLAPSDSSTLIENGMNDGDEITVG